jgi:DNA-binding transcriptional LysR family regulator
MPNKVKDNQVSNSPLIDMIGSGFRTMYDLRQIECFVAVAEELHFGRAAARLHMTRPPLSRQIQLLEHELQFPLFVRTSRSVMLTHAGAVFLEEARRLLAFAGNAAQAAKRIAKGESGLINLGFTAGSSYSFLPKLLAHTNTSLKKVDIVLHEKLTRDQVAALLDHTIDVSLLRRIFDDESIETACVAREPLMLAVPRGHRLATGRIPRLMDISAEPFITFSPVDGPYFHTLIERTLGDAGVAVRYTQRVGQIHSILSLVSAGQGIALVPESARAMNFRQTIIRRVRMAPVVAELFMAWRKDNLNPVLGSFLKTVLKAFAIHRD